jgi:hypothetical protein
MVLEPTLPNGVLRRSPRPGRAVNPTMPRSALVLALALLAACGGAGDEPEPAPPETCPIPVAVAAPTFSGHVLPMLRSTCGAADGATSCHGLPGPGVPAGHVSYANSLTPTQVRSQLVGVDPSNAPPGAGWKRVAAGDVAHSWLIEKITRDDPGGTGQAYGNRMPYGLPNLCAPTVQTVKAWITAGALND